MIPILYKANELEFTSNGIGPLADAITCDVIDERNGVYELEMQYPIDGIRYSDLSEDRYIYATVSDDSINKQAFKIYKITRPINGVVTVYAEHISYLLNKMIVMPYTANSCAEALALLPNFTVDTCPFTFTTDKMVDGEFTVSEPTPVRSLLGGSSGSILDVYGKGEYEFDMWNVRLLTNRGRNDNVVLLYGKNITELERTTDMTNVYTGIVPFWKGGDDDIVTLPEKVIWSDKADTYSYKIAKVVDFSSDWEGAPTFAQLRARANNYISKNEGWKIRDNIKVSFVNLADTVEFKDKASLMRVRLCDTVTVRYTKLGVDVEAKVVKTNWNVLKNRYNEIEIGEASSNFYKAIVEDSVNPIIENTSNFLQDELRRQGNLLSGGLGGYVVLNRDADGTPRELLVMNTPDKETATEILVINKNGIGFTDRYGGTPSSAWTLDGTFSANFIKTGAMSAARIRGGTLALGGTTAEGSYGAGSMAIYDTENNLIGRWNSGGILVKKGTIQGPTINVGGKDNGDGQLIVYDNAGVECGRWYNQGIIIEKGSLQIKKTSITDAVNPGLYIGQNGISGGRANSNPEFVMNSNGNCIFYNLKFFKNGNTETSKYGFWADSGRRIASGGCIHIATDNASESGYDDYNVFDNGGLRIYGSNRKAGVLYLGGEGWADNWRYNSDRRVKSNIKHISEQDSIEFISKLKPVSFIQHSLSSKERQHTHRHGFIAQEVAEITDWDLVTTSDEGVYGLDYTGIVADLVNTNQYLLRKLEARTKELNHIHSELDKLKEAVYGKTSN